MQSANLIVAFLQQYLNGRATVSVQHRWVLLALLHSFGGIYNTVELFSCMGGPGGKDKLHHSYNHLITRLVAPRLT